MSDQDPIVFAGTVLVSRDELARDDWKDALKMKEHNLVQAFRRIVFDEAARRRWRTIEYAENTTIQEFEKANA